MEVRDFSAEFAQHAERMRRAARERREAVQLRSVLEPDTLAMTSKQDDELLGKPMPDDDFPGDKRLRTLRLLLNKVDNNGFERCAAVAHSPAARLARHATLFCRRSPHQLQFHSAFERSVARILFRDTWGTESAAIMRKYGYAKCSSEVLIRCHPDHGPSHTRDARAPDLLVCVWQHAAPLRKDV